MFKKMGLRKYLVRVFGIIILLAAITTALGVVGLIITKNIMNHLINNIEVSDEAVKTCAQEANVAGRYVREMALSENTDTYRDYEAKIKASTQIIETQVDKFKASYGTKDGMAAAYETAFAEWFSIADAAIAELNSGNRDAAIQILLEQCSPALEKLLTITDEISQKTAAQKAKLVADSERQIAASIIVQCGILVLVVAVSITIAGLVAKNIAEATSELGGAVKELSQGNLNAVVAYEADNEFGQLSNLFNFCFAELKKYVEAISGAMKEFASGNLAVENDVKFIGDFQNIERSIDAFIIKIGEALHEVVNVSHEVNGGADQIASASQELAEGAADQSASVEELSATLAELSAKITTTADYMREIRQMMEETGRTVDAGNRKMLDMKEAMQAIADKSEEVRQIVHTIDKITAQTSLLSLNASIEAARAGAAGAGFAVVADEVSILARQSAEAAQSIAQLIEETIAAVDNGSEKVDETAGVLAEIVVRSVDITQKVEQVSTVAEEEAEGMQQLVKGIDQIAAVVQTNSASSQESAAASEELSAHAQMMSELITRFRIK